MPAVATYNCPFCAERKGSPDTKGHLYYYGDGKGYHCFRCGAHHSDGNLPAGITESPTTGALEELADPQEVGKDALSHAEDAWKHERARLYLMRRGITGEEVEEHGILYATSGWLQGRVVFPIYGRRGKQVYPAGPPEVVYFVARAIDFWRQPKYVNAPWGKNGLVYTVGLFPTQLVVVVEGIFDAFACHRAGFFAAALLGKRINAGQARTIASLARRAIVLLDSDAFASALEVSYQLSLYMPTKRVELPGDFDPADSDRRELRGLIAKAVKQWENEPKESPRFKRTPSK